MESCQNNASLSLAKTELTAITNTTGGIEITWNPVKKAASYDIYRRVSGKSWEKIASANGSVTKYADTSVKSKNGTAYDYKIQAVNKNIKGEFGGEKTICRLITPTLTSVKNNKTKKITAKWSKVKKVSGYEIQYSTSSNFRKATTKKVKSASKKSCIINKLNKKKTYYIRIRTYKKVSGSVYYSAWSSQKKVKIKK